MNVLTEYHLTKRSIISKCGNTAFQKIKCESMENENIDRILFRIIKTTSTKKSKSNSLWLHQSDITDLKFLAV